MKKCICVTVPGIKATNGETYLFDENSLEGCSYDDLKTQDTVRFIENGGKADLIEYVDRNSVFGASTENKDFWVVDGEEREHAFVKEIVPFLGLDIIVHPEKENNPYHVDLLDRSNNCNADLKTQWTPFFKAKDKYGINPQYAVTFNHKDYLNYKENADSILIYWWVKWIQLSKYGIELNPLHGV